MQSITDPKKVCHDKKKSLPRTQKKFATPLNAHYAHFNAHELQKIVNMSVDISETINDREKGSQL